MLNIALILYIFLYLPSFLSINADYDTSKTVKRLLIYVE